MRLCECDANKKLIISFCHLLISHFTYEFETFAFDSNLITSSNVSTMSDVSFNLLFNPTPCCVYIFVADE